jgi:formylglycine-generating enzyme required for sulfatase activity
MAGEGKPKPHGIWTYWGNGGIEYTFYWYGEEVSEGEWHLRNIGQTSNRRGETTATDDWENAKRAPEAKRRQQETARALGVEVERDVELARGVTLRLVLIPAGTFLMGSPGTEGWADERPQHKVTISRPFWLGKYEVTQAQWEAVMGGNPSHFKGATNPVEQVSWNDVQGFLQKLNARLPLPRGEGWGEGAWRFALPTEAQWAYACRAGTATAWCFGDGRAELRRYGWHSKNSDGKTHPVGQLQPNAWGLHSRGRLCPHRGEGALTRSPGVCALSPRARARRGCGLRASIQHRGAAE